MFLTTIFIPFLALSCAMAADDWVVHVAKGIDTASKVAKLHDLDNLGEVIPGMEILIFLFLKFIYSEKATNFSEISTIDLSYLMTVKSAVEISQNFVSFSEYLYDLYLN